ncbi:MBL fold metallo-hydrolase [Reinekea marinisedimentorum]|uniref:Ribonuclease BN (tRNA processing enzyme) n=1 Tax=Reinekea marinisedimentorum TaxID=230495 RepID=A0A4R3HSF0_9GAMM|nr:MBL fold metallo-hydrolase [Reinekea marinisedimentorum]TCS35868.1 ribonuclease BN (tRNA processing enzyme) [Reinekea marinisedimentorum]
MTDKKPGYEASRRDFLTTAGKVAGAVSLAATAGSTAFAASQTKPAGEPPAANALPEGFQVITIGIAGPPMDLPNRNRTWPATVVQFRDKYFLVDCGGGATHGLLKAGIEPSKVKNLLFTHHHADHNSDFFTFVIGGWNGPGGRRELNIAGPRQTQQLYDMMMTFYKEDLDYRMHYGFPAEGLAKNVTITEMAKPEAFVMDGVQVKAAEGIHTITNYAYRFEAEGQAVVVTGDTAYSEDIVELSKGADILVIDAHMAEGAFASNVLSNPEQRDNMRKAHMSNEDIAQTASKAKVKKVVLTHLPPLQVDEAATKQALRNAGYEGEIIIAETGGRYLA